MKVFINKLIDLIKNFYQTIKIKFINILNKNKEMKRIRDVWQGNLPPTDHNVLWLDTSGEKPILKTFLHQSWQEVSGGDASNIPLSSPIFLNIATEDPGGEPCTPMITKEKVLQIKSEFESGISTVLQTSIVYDSDIPEDTATVDIYRAFIDGSAYEDGISKEEYHLSWLSHNVVGDVIFRCVNFGIPDNAPWEILPLKITNSRINNDVPPPAEEEV